mmetsp:Transcript_18118/g.56213  ORF Transcript_18118/g.56213 Transcript_18118/m.56213 type:complete len:230 (-) Transcript_18118:73-762(-)
MSLSFGFVQWRIHVCIHWIASLFCSLDFSTCNPLPPTVSTQTKLRIPSLNQQTQRQTATPPSAPLAARQHDAPSELRRALCRTRRSAARQHRPSTRKCSGPLPFVPGRPPVLSLPVYASSFLSAESRSRGHCCVARVLRERHPHRGLSHSLPRSSIHRVERGARRTEKAYAPQPQNTTTRNNTTIATKKGILDVARGSCFESRIRTHMGPNLVALAKSPLSASCDSVQG